MSEDTATLVERVRDAAAVCAGEHPYEYAWGQFSAALDSLTTALERAEREIASVRADSADTYAREQAAEARAQKAEAEVEKWIDLEHKMMERATEAEEKLEKAEAVVGAARKYADDARTRPALIATLAALEREHRSEWREGLVNVLDHEGNYLGCLGSETWEWTLAGGIAELKAALERAEWERDEALHAAHLRHPATAGVMSDYQQQLRDRAEAAEARAQKAEADCETVERRMQNMEKQLGRAEAVVEAAREVRTQWRSGGLMTPYVDRLHSALAALDEPPTRLGGIEGKHYAVGGRDAPPPVDEQEQA